MNKDYKIISRQIKNIKIENDKFIIEIFCDSIDKISEYYSPIIKGSVLCTIETFDKKIVPLSYLENNDIIKMKIKDDVINKIYINTKFEMMKEISDGDYIN